MPKQPIVKIQKFYRKDSKRGRHFFRLIAPNGEAVAQSEGYTRKYSLDKTVSLLLKAKIVQA